MSEVVYFILQDYVLEETTYLKVPRALYEEAWIFIHDHSDCAVTAVADRFVSEPEEITSLREWLTRELDNGLDSFWRKFWMRERDFGLDDFKALAAKGDFNRIEMLILALKEKEIEADAPYRIYTVPADTPTLTGSPPPGSQFIIDREMAKAMNASTIGDEVPLEEIMADRRTEIAKIMSDLIHYYAAGLRLLKSLDALEAQEAT